MLKELKRELEQIAACGRSREFHRAARKAGANIEIRGKAVVDFVSTDFLGLASHKKVKRSAQEEIERYGISTSSPRLLTGTSDCHLSLEQRLAQFMGAESALLFSSKNQLILSLVTSIVSEQDFILIGEPSNAPVSDAAYLVNCPVVGFDVNNLSSAEAELEKHRSSRRKLIFVESISPVLAVRINTPELMALAARYDANLIVDETYSVGLFGVRGVGDSVHSSSIISGSLLSVPKQADGLVVIRYFDLSVVLGGFGAALVGPAIINQYIINSSRSFSAETSLPFSLVAATEVALDAMELMPTARAKIGGLAKRVRRGLSSLDFRQDPESDIPIVCLSFAEYQLAEEFVSGLFKKGFLVELASQKSLLREGGLVRLNITVRHSEVSVDSLLRAISELCTVTKFQ